VSNETEFVDGLIVKAPNDNAPEYVKARLSIKRQDLIAWLQGRDGDWINVEIKSAKSGKWYAAVDAWKPCAERQDKPAPKRAVPTPAPARNDPFPDDDIPF
jgi:hypothetical protein